MSPRRTASVITSPRAAFAAEAVPPLTTVRIPREEIGRLAGQMLVDRLAGKPVEPRVVDARFQIVGRESA
ncbi:MAG TPA: substrate-binding domain-containing protein [Candidatus Methylomirabilis sp.]